MLPVLPIIDVSFECINKASVIYHVPAKLIISVLHIERGKNGQISKNTNGTYDIGLMQINSLWLPQLKKYGISQSDIQYDACKNLKVGTWILGKKIANGDDLLVGIGDYHSHTQHYNQNYYTKVKFNLAKIDILLT